MFSNFQTESGTLKKMGLDYTGSYSELSELPVRVDPDFGFKQTFGDDGQRIETRKTIVDTNDNSLRSFWDDTHRNWVLTYKGKDWTVHEATPRHSLVGNKLEFLELLLT